MDLFSTRMCIPLRNKRASGAARAYERKLANAPQRGLAPRSAFICAGVAQAKVAVPFQDSIRKAGSSSEASQGSYGMEGRPQANPWEHQHTLTPAHDGDPEKMGSRDGISTAQLGCIEAEHMVSFWAASCGQGQAHCSTCMSSQRTWVVLIGALAAPA